MLSGAASTPDELEAEALDELTAALRASVETVPQDVGIRSLVLVGNPRRLIEKLALDGGYDLVVIPSPGRFSRSRRALARRLVGSIELLIVPRIFPEHI